MVISSSDEKRFIDVGGADIWFCLYSTVCTRVKNAEKRFPLAIEVIKNGEYSGTEALEAARQINLIRDELAGISPDKVVYDVTNPTLVAPWEGRISPVITSCANFYTTADGKDLLFELVSILCYAAVAKVDIYATD